MQHLMLAKSTDDSVDGIHLDCNDANKWCETSSCTIRTPSRSVVARPVKACKMRTSGARAPTRTCGDLA
eukprot:scaffold670_cov333-Pavlova_lutheri.AAC.16